MAQQRKRRRTKKKLPAMVDPALLQIKKVPADIINAEKVTERLTNTKLNAKRKLSTKIKAAIKNYQNAVTRKKRADTLLEKHFKILSRYSKKYLQNDFNNFLNN